MTVSTPMMSDLAAAWQPDVGRSEYNGIAYLPNDARPVGGSMAPVLGPRLVVAPLVRAYEVLPLIAATFSCHSESQLADSIKVLFAGCCESFDWRLDREGRLSGPLRKYGVVHANVGAPRDETTRQPMAVEFFAEVVRLGSEPIGPGARWIDGWRSRYGDDYGRVEVAEPFELAIRAATYANVRYPGIDVPLYL
jgi:hypothetical protein